MDPTWLCGLTLLLSPSIPCWAELGCVGWRLQLPLSLNFLGQPAGAKSPTGKSVGSKGGSHCARPCKSSSQAMDPLVCPGLLLDSLRLLLLISVWSFILGLGHLPKCSFCNSPPQLLLHFFSLEAGSFHFEACISCLPGPA